MRSKAKSISVKTAYIYGCFCWVTRYFLRSSLMLHRIYTLVSLPNRSQAPLCSPQPPLFLYRQPPHQCCMRYYLDLSHLCLPPQVFYTPRLFHLRPSGACRTTPSAVHATTSPVVLFAPPSALFIFSGCPTSSRRGHRLSQIAGRSRSLIIPLTVHLSDKTEERGRERGGERESDPRHH